MNAILMLQLITWDKYDQTIKMLYNIFYFCFYVLGLL